MNKIKEYKTPNGYTWYRLENDSYGNPRIMTHFLNLVSPMQEREAHRLNADNACASIETLKQWAREAVNGKSYRAKWFGGGIVWTSYLNDEQINKLIDGIQADK
jgi:hypothetical protein